MPAAINPMPMKTIHHVTSSKIASSTCPAFSLRMKLTAMPVTIWTIPRAMAPTRIISVSFSGVNRAGRAKSPPVVSFTTWVRKSPKKPPVSAPQKKVETPHSCKRPIIWPMVPLGRYFFETIVPARNIKMP